MLFPEKYKSTELTWCVYAVDDEIDKRFWSCTVTVLKLGTVKAAKGPIANHKNKEK